MKAKRTRRWVVTGVAAVLLAAAIGVPALLLSGQGAQEPEPTDGSEPGLSAQGTQAEGTAPADADRAGFVRQEGDEAPPYGSPRKTRTGVLEPTVLLSHDDWTYLTDFDAKYHTDKPFIFTGTVTEVEDIEAPENYYEIPVRLTVAVDRVYSGEAFATGDTTDMFFPISRYFNSKGEVTQDGPVMEAGRSYVFFCNLPGEEGVRSWLAERYPEHPALIESVGLVVSWDIYCFPVKEGLVCAWMGIWGEDPPSLYMTAGKAREFNGDLFYGVWNGKQAVLKDMTVYYTEDELAYVIEVVKQREPMEEAAYPMLRISD
jgi:hypothetical protein